MVLRQRARIRVAVATPLHGRTLSLTRGGVPQMKKFIRDNCALMVVVFTLLLAMQTAAAAPELPNPVLYFIGQEFFENAVSNSRVTLSMSPTRNSTLMNSLPHRPVCLPVAATP